MKENTKTALRIAWGLIWRVLAFMGALLAGFVVMLFKLAQETNKPRRR